MKKTVSLLLISLMLAAGSVAQKADSQSDLRSLVETERAFARTAAEKGIRDSFLAYLADDGVLFRPQPVNGKQWMSARPARPGLLIWEPTFAYVSRAGDLGYDTGPWEFKEKGPDDKPIGYGYFVTVWKKQRDGTWKFIVDIGTSNPAPTRAETGWQPPANDGKKPKTAKKVNVEAEQSALLNLDREFSKASVARGIVDAYLSYIDDDVRFYRDGAFPVIGRAATRAALSERQGVMNWQPVKAGVAISGDLGYTYGTYDFKGSGAPGTEAENGGYARVWRRDANGKWKVVLDILNPAPPPAPPKTASS
ncbi:MAG: nuclear transport factor 2 family protein [Pyrinomonadaceae bacterium]